MVESWDEDELRFAAEQRDIDGLLERGGYDESQRAAWWARRRGTLAGRTPWDALRFGETATVRLMAQRVAGSRDLRE
jgi:hypothetical protein